MLRIHRLTPESGELDAVRALYESAFPENERRSLDGMLREKSGALKLLSFFEEERFIGLLFLLECGDISHIIYFAVTPELRGQGYGGRILRAVEEGLPGQRLILDIEKPSERAENNAQRLRRKDFYLRHGYRESSVRYRWRGESYEILVLGGELSKRGFYRFWRDLQKSGFSFADWNA